jgi:DNA-directed RNA polymerase subunit alpha
MLEDIKINHSSKGSQGTVVIEPLPQGYGVTLGNALRRVLLSSLPGAAITAAKISGVSHEYSTIKGVKEDVVQILLNLKNIRLKIDSEKPVKLSLEAKGPKTVTAGDIKTPNGVEVTNPELVIATVADNKTKLEMELTAEKGTGFRPIEDRRSAGIGTIPLDATFSPVLRVNYWVEATRVGQVTNFDKLSLELITDGTMVAGDAVKEASKILIEFFDLLAADKKTRKETAKKEVKKADIDQNASVEELELSTRVTNSLKAAGIETVKQLVETPKEELMKLKNTGSKSITDIEKKLKEKGLVE